MENHHLPAQAVEKSSQELRLLDEYSAPWEQPTAAFTVWEMGKNPPFWFGTTVPFGTSQDLCFVLGGMLIIMMIAGQPLSVASLLHSPLLKLGPTIFNDEQEGSQGQHESWPAPVAISHPSPFVLLVHSSILFRWINPCFDKFWTGKNCLMNIPQKPAGIWDKPNTNNH